MSPAELFAVLVAAFVVTGLVKVAAMVTVVRLGRWYHAKYGRQVDVDIEGVIESHEDLINEHDRRLFALESHVDLKWEGP